jgi:hypothetical protein
MLGHRYPSRQSLQIQEVGSMIVLFLESVYTVLPKNVKIKIIY